MSLPGTSRTSQMSDLSPQSGPKRTLIRSLSPVAIVSVHASNARLSAPAAPAPGGGGVRVRRDRQTARRCGRCRAAEQPRSARRRPPQAERHRRAADRSSASQRRCLSRSSGIGDRARRRPALCRCLRMKARTRTDEGATLRSPSGRRDQMTVFIGRREFITLLGGASGGVAAGGACAAASDAADRVSPKLDGFWLCASCSRIPAGSNRDRICRRSKRGDRVSLRR